MVVTGSSLSVTKTSDAGGTVDPSDMITYTITVTNTGTTTHTGLSITDAVPTGTTFIDSTISGGSSGTVRDNFDTVSYSNDDGSDTWGGPWIEFGDDGTPGGGEVRIDSAPGAQVALDIGDDLRGIERDVDLSGVSDADLTFDYCVYHVDHSNEEVYVDIWDGFTWNTVQSFIPPLGDSSSWQQVSVDITPFAALASKVRISTGTNSTSWGMHIDNFEISYAGGGSGPGDPPPVIAFGKVARRGRIDRRHLSGDRRRSGFRATGRQHSQCPI